jgi:hypothetical protein
MDQAAKDRIQREIEDQVRTLFPGAVRRVEWQSHRDDPHFQPGELASSAAASASRSGASAPASATTPAPAVTKHSKHPRNPGITQSAPACLNRPGFVMAL